MTSILRRILKRISGGKRPELLLKQPASEETPPLIPFALSEGERKGEQAARAIHALMYDEQQAAHIRPQEVKKMPDEEHDEQELEEDDDEAPECFGEYDPDDKECEDCEVAKDCEDETPDEEDSDDGKEDEREVPQPVSPEDKRVETEPSKKQAAPGAPEHFQVFKVVKKKILKDGVLTERPVLKNVSEVYEGEPPGKEDIEAAMSPLYGGGKYSIRNTRTGKVVRSYNIDGPPVDPDEPVPPMQPLAAAFPIPGAAPVPAQGGQPQQVTAVDRIQWAMAQGSNKAVEQLAVLAERLSASDDIEKLNTVVAALKEIATGRKDATPTDRLTEMLMADRQMMLSNILEGKKGKESSSSDIVRETMSTMKEMFSLAKEFAPGEDTGVQMVREVSGVVKDGLKEVTDTVIQVTGSKPLKQVEPPAPRYVYKCERCKSEVQPHFKACPSCGLVFKPGVITTPPPAPPAAPVEVFEKPAPPLPQEVRDKVGYLKRIAVFIQNDHDAATKGTAFFKQADPESKLQLLFTANFGYRNIMKLVAPWRFSKEIPEGEAIFRTVESPNGQLWIHTFFRAIRQQAEEENIQLDQGTIEKYLDEINRYSPVKFNYRPKAKVSAPLALPGPPVVKKVKGEPVGMSICPVCDEQVPTVDLKDHLFSKHPKAPLTPRVEKVNQRVKQAIAQGAVPLPRAGVPELPVEEPLTPNDQGQGDGTEE